MLWCESVAPLGKPVVPLVYWMLTGSSKATSAARARTSSVEIALPPSSSSSHSGVSKKIARSSSGSSGRTSAVMAT